MMSQPLTLLRRACLGFVFALSTFCAHAAGLQGAAKEALDTELRAIADDPVVSLVSLSALAIRDGQIVYQQQFGMRRLDLANPAASKPANADTLYRIASISKLVTSLGVMKLVEAGKLDLDTDVSTYLGYPLRNPNFPDRPISLRMLMSHTSSLRDDGGYNFDPRLPLRDFLVPGGARYGKGAVWSDKQPPGYFQYVNLNWGVIGTIMERASGERFDRLMKRLVLDPLGIPGGYHSADFSPAELDNLATLYRKRVDIDGREVWRPEGPWVPQTDDQSAGPPAPRAGPDYVIGSNGTVFGPQGSLRISAAGLAKIMLMLMNEGKAEGRSFLQPQSIAAMFAVQWKDDGTNGATDGGQAHAWGLGVQHTTDQSAPGKGDRLVAQGGWRASGHFGNAWGLTSAFFFDFARKEGVIYMMSGSNRDPWSVPGLYSSMPRHEERIIDALYRHALRPQ